jgi:hypothetical protein
MPSYLEIALKAATPAKPPDTTLESRSINTGRETRAESQEPKNRAACGSPECAGCYEVAPGVRIHPPKCSDDYRAWRQTWEAKCRVQ